MKKYDVIIIGSGLGGLACGAILSKEGLSVCILEQQSTLGGCLQSFNREGYSLDTGMHYIGSFSEGQTLHQYFKYFGVLEDIKLQKLDESGFDIINLGNGKEYRHAMGYERFVETLCTDFPEEREGLQNYISLLKEVGNLIRPNILRTGKISNGGVEYMGQSIYETINHMIKSLTLRNVIAGSIPLYGYNRNTSSTYEHAMINNSNIEGAYRFVNNTQHVADAFIKVIRNNGGEIYNRSKVTKINIEASKVSDIEINHDLRIKASHIISSIHPVQTLSLLENNNIIKKAFFTRVQSLENSFGLFTTYLLLKPKTFKNLNRNYYLYNTKDVWNKEADYKSFNIPLVLVSSQVNENDEYASVISLLTPMKYSYISQWENTTTGQRGKAYQDFKQQFSEMILDFTCRFFPGLRSCIKSIHSTSPLTYRDYNSTPYGSAYGILKDCNNPIVSHLSSRTKIENLFFTGQSLNVHGCLGVSVSAAVTCGEIIGMEYLAQKIGNQ